MSIQERIEQLVTEQPVVLFMKGDRQQPQCGFSATVVDILDEYLAEYATVDVLADPELRQGIKDYASWPTIPQLYVGGKFVGGCDIVREMRHNRELDEVLGTAPRALPEPVITLTAAAERVLLELHEGDGKPQVRLGIGRDFGYEMGFDAAGDDDLVVDAGAVALVVDRASARRADGMRIDYVEGAQGAGFKIDNPNEPPKVQQVSPAELARWIDEGAPMEVLDVRTAEERARAVIEGTRLLDEEALELVRRLDPDTRLVFYCHHGMRSHQAAQHFLELGFRQVYNLAGGIDAWSREVDPSVPRY